MNSILQPMLASLADAPLDDPAPRLRTEVRRHPRDRGDRATAASSASGRGSATRRRASFPRSPPRSDSGRAARKEPLVLDGEIVALDAKGEPTGFQQLQGRIHLIAPKAAAAAGATVAASRSTSFASDVAFIAFDLLRDGRTDLRDRPWPSGARRSSACSATTGSPLLRLSDVRCAATAARCTNERSSAAGKG